MVDLNLKALRRRSRELHDSYGREESSNLDSAALLLFYSAECGLKSIYMERNNLRDTSSSTISAESARSFGHNLIALVKILNVPASKVGPPPIAKTVRVSAPVAVVALHEAWRYGEKLTPTEDICEWLISIVKWCKEQ